MAKTIFEEMGGTYTQVGDYLLPDFKLPEKSDYEPKTLEAYGTVSTDTLEEIAQFLETFFKLYPTITETEISYYVRGNALKPIQNESYVFSKLEKPVLTMSG